MNVILLPTHPTQYSCNSHLVLGDWNRLEDTNTLIDVGIDGFVIGEIEKIHTGVGKEGIERVILTHNHFDHAGGLGEVVKRFHPEILAFAPGPHVDRLLVEGEIVKVGDRSCRVFHVQAHSDDSICLYCQEEGVLFSGDTPLQIRGTDGTYSRDFLRFLEKLNRLHIERIYSGHDYPILRDALKILRTTLENVRHARILD